MPNPSRSATAASAGRRVQFRPAGALFPGASFPTISSDAVPGRASSSPATVSGASSGPPVWLWDGSPLMPSEPVDLAAETFLGIGHDAFQHSHSLLQFPESRERGFPLLLPLRVLFPPVVAQVLLRDAGQQHDRDQGDDEDMRRTHRSIPPGPRRASSSRNSRSRSKRGDVT